MRPSNLTLSIITLVLLAGCKLTTITTKSSTKRAPTGVDGGQCAILRVQSRTVINGEQVSEVPCAEVSHYIFNVRKFSPELPESARPVSESVELPILLDGESQLVAADLLSFSTRQAFQVDSDAQSHPQVYDYTEYQVGFRGLGQQAIFSKDSESSLAEAFSKAFAECTRRVQEGSAK